MCKKNEHNIHHKADILNIKSEKELLSFLEKEEVCKILSKEYYSKLKREIRINFVRRNCYNYRK